MNDPATNQTRLVDSDTDSFLFSNDFQLACVWNSSIQQCEYRCNWLYQFGDTLMSERIASIRTDAHYVFGDYGAGCTGFNTRPSRNGNRICTICEDPNFNPPECFDVPKYPDCLTRCNRLPNCTTVCQNVLATGFFASEPDQDKRKREAFLACCTPMRMQMNGETERLATESCLREYYLMKNLDMTSARNISCIETHKKYENYPRTTDYCSTEICHFRIMEQNITDRKNRWVESALSAALASDCVQGSCGILTSVASQQDGQLAIAMGDTAMLGAEPSQRFQTALNILLSLLPFDALLTLETARLSNPATDGDPWTVSVQTILFNVYQKTCPVNAPCSLQEGVLLRNLETKYLIMFRSLLASGRSPSIVDEILYRQGAREDWENTLPAYIPNLKPYSVPPYYAEISHIPQLSSIDHFHSRQALRRLSDGASREMETGPTVGAQRVGDCVSEPGLACSSASGARKMNRRRNPCFSTSLYRPDEIPYSRPTWRYELDQWISPYGDLGKWVGGMMNWRIQSETEEGNSAYGWTNAGGAIADLIVMRSCTFLVLRA
eukprot:CAMPEP_0172156942 /NCGR_PEP_ID=MMETSP1050-20130122/3510_1 /TAXON_ID=233186 /ORGANISM="Cryptomonas curvata, Strain CCAP979/52" /LENGTH=551 /DNA_ID=CAMNT_0012826105 /DNA_START=231 /DNA_END=1887 /DNA_ORIENTATION=+